MFTKIDYNSKVPIYVQIKNQIKYLIATGELKPNDRLPPVRELAATLKVNPTSTARVYRDLEMEKLIITKQGRGSFISEEVPKLEKDYRMKTIIEETKKLISLSYQLGLDKDELRKIIEEEIKKVNI